MAIDFSKLSCVGILGGTFNPIHNGHLNMAKSAYEQCDDMEKMIIMPNNLPAYKDTKKIVDNSHRLNMLKLATKDYDYLEISDLELLRGGVTYTYDTLSQIKGINPNIKIYFVIGADSLYSIRKWYRFEEIFSMCTLLVVIRDTKMKDMEDYANELKSEYKASIKLLSCEEVKASSTEIRDMVFKGIRPVSMLPNQVIDYIFDNSLYR